MGTFINPFDFGTIFINYFAGDPLIFTAAAFIVISFLAGLFKLPDKIYLPVLGLFVVMFASAVGDAIYVLAIVITSIAVFKGISKLVT